MSVFHITTAILGTGLTLGIIYLLRKDHLHPASAIFWMTIAVFAGLLGLWPRLIDRLANLVGISYPPSLLLLAVVALLIIKALYSDIVQTRFERDLRRINQKLAVNAAQSTEA